MELVILLCLAAAVGAGYLIFRSTEDAAKVLSDLEEKKEIAPEPAPRPAKKPAAKAKTPAAKPAVKPTAKPATRGRKPKK